MGRCSTDGPARRAWMPGGAGTDLRAFGAAAGRQRYGAGPGLRNRCGMRPGRAGCRRSAPPSVSRVVPYFLARPKNPCFSEKYGRLEKKAAGCGHRRLGNSRSGGNVGGISCLARFKSAGNPGSRFPFACRPPFAGSRFEPEGLGVETMEGLSAKADLGIAKPCRSKTYFRRFFPPTFFLRMDLEGESSRRAV